MDLSDLTPLFNPAHIYAGGKAMAAFIATTVTPVALAISLWLRIGASQLDTVSAGTGKWSAFARDLALWLPVLGMYFAAASLVTELFQTLYNAFHEHGSAAKMHAVFEKFLDNIESREPEGVLGALSFLASGALIIPWTLYYFSVFISSLVFIAMQLAHALAYSFALSWGLIAIPLSIGNIRLLKGWGVFSGTVLLWPLVHYMTFALFNPLFIAAGEHYLSDDGVLGALADKMQYYLILTTVNFIAAGLSLSAPFIAASLVNNSGSVHGLVMPFAAAATAATAAAVAGTGMAAARRRRQATGGGEGRNSSASSGGGAGGATPQPNAGAERSAGHGSAAAPEPGATPEPVESAAAPEPATTPEPAESAAAPEPASAAAAPRARPAGGADRGDPAPSRGD